MRETPGGEATVARFELTATCASIWPATGGRASACPPDGPSGFGLTNTNPNCAPDRDPTQRQKARARKRPRPRRRQRRCCSASPPAPRPQYQHRHPSRPNAWSRARCPVGRRAPVPTTHPQGTGLESVLPCTRCHGTPPAGLGYAAPPRSRASVPTTRSSSRSTD